MKNTIKYMLMFACSLASVLSCARFDEQEETPVAEPKVRMTFKAEIEGDADTKTVLGGQMGDQYRKVLWEPGDSIGVINSLWYNNMDPFVNTEDEVSQIATFEGNADYGDSDYYMFYPYDKNLYCRDDDKIDFTLPSGQRYKDQSFDSGIMPMVAKGRRTERFQFQSLCGVLALNLTGSETIKSVSFSGRDASGNPIPVAGDFYVYMHYDAYPEITLREEGMTSATVTLDCGEGIAIDPANPTPFYIVLPVGTYNEFSIVVATTDGKLMLKGSKNPLTIKRANVTKTGALAYVADVAVDLSETGHANCYVVPKSGLYSFDADVIGNGDFGLVDNANFHTKNTSIEPASAEIVWEDKTGVIGGLAFDGKKVSFMSTGTEGNALVAVKDANGTILWSWHIWVTDQPQEQVYVNDRGTFTMLDRNIGATRNDRGTGEEYRESMGMRYQWGRKDPFGRTAGSMRTDLYDMISSQLSITETVQYPKSFVRENNTWTNEWDNNLWPADQKTIYDPCPVGYRVPPMDAWRGFTVDGDQADRRSEINANGSFDHGWNFIYDGVNTTWYPSSSHIDIWGGYGESETEGSYWSTDVNGNSWSHYFRFHYDIYSENPDFNCGVSFNNIHDLSNALAVRCMKDEGHVDISYPVIKITEVVDVTSESAVVVANVTDEGASPVTERGILWGSTEDLTVDNAEKIVAETAGAGEYRTTFTGLQNATVYYVRPYAINDKGLSYGKVTSFRTTYSGEANNLSAYGTSNCYIVDPAYSKHYINGSVKGHTYESIGSVASVEVLWETNGYGMKIEPGSVIFDVTLKDGNIYFYTNGVEGNALVASKDAMGTILWSWHIWVTDTPKEQLYNSIYWVLDRNLGAVSAEEGTGEQWKLSCGLQYQCGRKDPFAGGAFTQENRYFSVEDAIKHPTVHDNVWSNPSWSATEKSLYDPCPVGYRIVVNNIWDGVSVTESINNHGTYFYFDSNPSVRYWYPYQAWHCPSGIEYRESGRIMSAEQGYYWVHTNDRFFYHCDWVAQVRCMKDEGYVDMSYPTVKMNATTDISSTGATINAEVTNTGIAEITSRGFFWGTSEDLSPEKGTKIDCGSGSGKFTATLDGLSHSTRYYVMSYATSERGTSYSNVVSFFTPYEGSAVNLSKDGTANCYIVPPVYSEYAFNASVKGNSDESVGAIAEAVVLWETCNTSTAIEKGDVIESVSFDGNMVHFFLPSEPKPGNALIAVKDALGTILWSWHIWVVDFDPVATQQTYISGAVMMDRNLGALNVTPGDIGSFGLMYQWGRKDPFVGAGLYDGWQRAFTAPSDAISYQYYDSSTDTIENATKNPTIVYNDARWGEASNLWGYKKTKYDPCPAGWRVSDLSAWESAGNSMSGANSGIVIDEPCSVPAAYIPGSGRSEGDEYIHSIGDCAYIWLTEYKLYMDIGSFYIYSNSWGGVDHLRSVRCMKDDGAQNSGSGDDYIVDDEYEW